MLNLQLFEFKNFLYWRRNKRAIHLESKLILGFSMHENILKQKPVKVQSHDEESLKGVLSKT